MSEVVGSHPMVTIGSGALRCPDNKSGWFSDEKNTMYGISIFFIAPQAQLFETAKSVGPAALIIQRY